VAVRVRVVWFRPPQLPTAKLRRTEYDVKERFNTATIMEVEPTDYALLVSGGCIWEPMGVPIEHAS